MPYQLHKFGLAAVNTAVADAEFAGDGINLLTAASISDLAHQPPLARKHILTLGC